MERTLILLDETFGICRLGPDAAPPASAWRSVFCAVARTADELSIVCESRHLPRAGAVVDGWRCLKVAYPLAFTEIGVLAGLAAPLAEAGISIFVVSTFDTDYLLVKAPDLENAIARLAAAGWACRRGMAAFGLTLDSMAILGDK